MWWDCSECMRGYFASYWHSNRRGGDKIGRASCRELCRSGRRGSDLIARCIPAANECGGTVLNACVVILPAIGIQTAAAEIVIQGTVEFVGSGLHCHVHHAAEIVTKIGRSAAGD